MDLRRTSAVFAALLAASPLAAPAARADVLTVTVDAIRSDRGRVFVCLFASPRGFPDCSADTGATRASQPARAPRVSFQFDVAAGVYAVSAFHDEAGTGKLETNFFGIPRSGVGASRDARGRFGPPSFDDAAFSLGPRGGSIALSLVYP